MTAPPTDLKLGTIELKDKPTATLHYSLLSGHGDSNTLIVFLNGLILPQSSWVDTISQIALKTEDLEICRPHILSYDRYGQGLSDKHPDSKHDIKDVVKDLHSFLQAFMEKVFNSGPPKHLVFVANSIGCAIARLFAARYPDEISGFIFLDSIMAHVDLVALWPDTSDPSFDKRTLPEGTTVEQLREVREKYKKIFDVHAPNPEGLDRSGLDKLLPASDSPKLKGVDGKPWITVIGHDPDTFAQENKVYLYSSSLRVTCH